MGKIAWFIVVATFALGVVGLGVDWLLWKLWRWVLPQIWDAGPKGFISPGFWLFVAATTLLSMLTGGLTPGGKSS